MKNYRFNWVLSLISSVAIFFLAGCAGEPTSAPPTGLAPTATTQQTQLPQSPVPAVSSVPSLATATAPSATLIPRAPTGTIVIAGTAFSREITTLPEFVANALFDSLLRVNPQDGALAPGLAESWSVSDDAKTFTFTLRQGVKWHDGKPLTTDDVVFTLKALSNPDLRLTPAADFGSIADITASDARTVKVTLREAYCAALTYIGAVNILPKHRLQDKSFSDVAPADLIGTGPLVLQKSDDSATSFTANLEYWDGAPQLGSWTYKIFADERAARDAVRQGQADLVVSASKLDGTQNAASPANEFYALALNTTRKPLDDARLRQAVAFALDRARLLQDMGSDNTGLTTSLLPNFWAHPANVSSPSYDVARARQLLADAGWRDNDGDGILAKEGISLEVTLWAQADEPRSELAAQLVRAQLEQIGVRAVLKLTDRTLFLTRLFLHEYDLAIAHLNIPLDPDQHYFWASGEDKPGFGLNVTGYTNSRVEDALAAGLRTTRCEATARKAVYAPVFQQLALDVPMVYLFAPPRIINARAQVQGLAPSSFAGAFWNLNQWQIAP